MAAKTSVGPFKKRKTGCEQWEIRKGEQERFELTLQDKIILNIK